MSTTSGNSKQLRVIDPNGNIWLMTLVDRTARNAIDGARMINFDEDFFTASLSQDQKEVNVGLNGVPIGVDSDSPLKFVQDNQQGIVLGSDASFATALAPEYDATATYPTVGTAVMYKGLRYVSNTAITTAEQWTPAHWDESDIESQFTDVEDALSDVNDILEDISANPGITDLGNKTESDLVSGALTITNGNSTTKLTLTTVNALTVISNVGVPNFALAIDNTGNSNNVTVSVVESDGTTAMLNSTAGGVTITAGKFVQLTAVGKCWTMAEFDVPSV
jgi:hypothetical protein